MRKLGFRKLNWLAQSPIVRWCKISGFKPRSDLKVCVKSLLVPSCSVTHVALHSWVPICNFGHRVNGPWLSHIPRYWMLMALIGTEVTQLRDTLNYNHRHRVFQTGFLYAAHVTLCSHICGRVKYWVVRQHTGSLSVSFQLSRELKVITARRSTIPCIAMNYQQVPWRPVPLGRVGSSLLLLASSRTLPSFICSSTFIPFYSDAASSRAKTFAFALPSCLHQRLSILGRLSKLRLVV